jgi:hypothetical protein
MSTKLKATKLGDGHYLVALNGKTIELDRVGMDEGRDRWIGVYADTGEEIVNAATKRGALEALASGACVPTEVA